MLLHELEWTNYCSSTHCKMAFIPGSRVRIYLSNNGDSYWIAVGHGVVSEDADPIEAQCWLYKLLAK